MCWFKLANCDPYMILLASSSFRSTQIISLILFSIIISDLKDFINKNINFKLKKYSIFNFSFQCVFVDINCKLSILYIENYGIINSSKLQKFIWTKFIAIIRVFRVWFTRFIMMIV